MITGFEMFLGAVRVFEFRKKAGAPNFIRFPLFPGAVFSVKLVFYVFFRLFVADGRSCPGRLAALLA